MKTKITIGADFLTKDLLIDSRKVSLQIWDTAGQEKFRSLGKAYYRGTDICMLVFSVTEKQSLSNLNSWIDSFISLSKAKDSNQDFPFVILGNKIDEPERLITKEEAEKWCEKNGKYSYFEVSAKTGENVEKAFLEATQKALLKMDSYTN